MVRATRFACSYVVIKNSDNPVHLFSGWAGKLKDYLEEKDWSLFIMGLHVIVVPTNFHLL